MCRGGSRARSGSLGPGRAVRVAPAEDPPGVEHGLPRRGDSAQPLGRCHDVLGLNAVRLLAGIKASWFTLILGTIALLSGLGSVYGINIPVGPLLIILIGLAIVVRAFQPRW